MRFVLSILRKLEASSAKKETTLKSFAKRSVLSSPCSMRSQWSEVRLCLWPIFVKFGQMAKHLNFGEMHTRIDMRYAVTRSPTARTLASLQSRFCERWLQWFGVSVGTTDGKQCNQLIRMRTPFDSNSQLIDSTLITGHLSRSELCQN